MDLIDAKILEALSLNARSTASEISKAVGLSIPAVSDRIKKLEETNIIEQYTIRINRDKIGYSLIALTFLTVDHLVDPQPLKQLIEKAPEIVECHHLAGDYDYMLKVVLKDTNEFETFLNEKLRRSKGIKGINTMVVLSTLKDCANR